MGALDKLANKLYGGNRLEVSASLASVDTYTYLAEAVSDSEDGLVSIVISDDVTQAEGIEDDGEWLSADELSTAISVPTTVSVKAGDVVMVTASGAEVLNPMVVTGVVGRGDEQAAEVEDAVSKAGQALTIAEATGQHFWPDRDGIHVTEVTEEEWKDSSGQHYHSGMNVLINSLGQLFRNGLTNLMALLPSGIALYDGNGNQQTNVIASFDASGTTLGYENADHATVNQNGLTIYDGVDEVGHFRADDVQLLASDPEAALRIWPVSAIGTYLQGQHISIASNVKSGNNQVLNGVVIGDGEVKIASPYLAFEYLTQTNATKYLSVPMQEVMNEFDTATKTLTLTNLGGSPQLTLTRRGHWVLAQMNNVVNPSSANTNISCGTVPTGYRPNKDAFYSGVGAISTTLGGFFRWRVATAGTITFICSATGNRECQLLMYWYTDDAWPTS